MNTCLNHRYMTYDFCRNCKHEDISCPEYLADNHSRQTKPFSDAVAMRSNESKDKTADTYIPMIIRKNQYVISKTQKVLEMIRSASDGGCI